MPLMLVGFQEVPRLPNITVQRMVQSFCMAFLLCPAESIRRCRDVKCLDYCTVSGAHMISSCINQLGINFAA